MKIAIAATIIGALLYTGILKQDIIQVDTARATEITTEAKDKAQQATCRLAGNLENECRYKNIKQQLNEAIERKDLTRSLKRLQDAQDLYNKL